jgi:ankyrin repeat protein
VRRLLQWLVYSRRPLRVIDLAEALVVEVDGHPRVNVENRFELPQEAFMTFSSLITIYDPVTYSSGNHDTELEDSEPEDSEVNDSETNSSDANDVEANTNTTSRELVRLAHFSVLEYLESARIAQGPASKYCIRELESHEEIARTCLIYLLQFTTLADFLSLAESRLAEYAAKYWAFHARSSLEPDNVVDLAEKLLLGEQIYSNCWTFDKPFNEREKTSPLYYASLSGLVKVAARILGKTGHIDAQGGKYGTALQAACFHGHQAVVELLLSSGADVNAQGGYYGNALQAACLDGHQAIVELLLSSGADLNAQGGYYGNALQAASSEGHQAVVELLLSNGADVNVQGGYYGNALQAACFGHQAIVELLLSIGADVNAKGGVCGNALQAACRRGDQAIVELLLSKGADIDALDDDGRSALYWTVTTNRRPIVDLLLERGANVNAGWSGKRPLDVARKAGDVELEQLLLEHGATETPSSIQSGHDSESTDAASGME